MSEPEELGLIRRLVWRNLFVKEVTASTRGVRRGKPVQIEALIQNLKDVEDTVRDTMEMFDIQVVTLRPETVSLGPRGAARASFRWDVARHVRIGNCGARVQQVFGTGHSALRFATESDIACCVPSKPGQSSLFAILSRPCGYGCLTTWSSWSERPQALSLAHVYYPLHILGREELWNRHCSSKGPEKLVRLLLVSA